MPNRTATNARRNSRLFRGCKAGAGNSSNPYTCSSSTTVRKHTSQIISSVASLPNHDFITLRIQNLLYCIPKSCLVRSSRRQSCTNNLYHNP